MKDFQKYFYQRFQKSFSEDSYIIVKNFISILIFSFVHFCCYAQSGSACLNTTQLLKLQLLSFNDLNSFLTGEGWSVNTNPTNQTEQYFGYKLNYSVVIWEKRNTQYYEGKIYLYMQPSKPNLLIYHANIDCFNSILNSLTNSQTVDNRSFKSSYITNPNDIIFETKEYKNDNTSLRFSILVYNKRSINNQVKEIEAEIARIRAAEELRKNTISRNIFIGDSLFNIGKYNDAKLFFERVRLYIDLKKGELHILKLIEDNILECQKNSNRVMIENSIEEGDIHYKQKEFEDAIKSYENAVKMKNSILSNIDPAKIDELVQNRIPEAKKNQSYLILQRTYQSYLKYNQIDCETLKGKNCRIIDEIISSNQKYGFVNFRSVIKFDKYGNNISYIKIDTVSIYRFNNYITTNVDFSGLKPIRIEDYFIPAIEELFFDVKWGRHFIIANARHSNIVLDKPSKHDYLIKRFINQQPFTTGKYKIQVVDKKLNDKSFSDLILVKYRNNNGPFNSLYSLILPGWGTKNVTNGSKGTSKMVFFLLSTAISGGSKIYSNIQYNKFKETMGQPGNNYYYNNANIANHIFLISGGISAIIYIHDFFWVIGKGINNLNKSKEFKNKVKTDPIEVLKSPIK